MGSDLMIGFSPRGHWRGDSQITETKIAEPQIDFDCSLEGMAERMLVSSEVNEIAEIRQIGQCHGAVSYGLPPLRHGEPPSKPSHKH